MSELQSSTFQNLYWTINENIYMNRIIIQRICDLTTEGFVEKDNSSANLDGSHEDDDGNSYDQ